MKLSIKLMPPYHKKGDPDELLLELDSNSVDLQQLAGHLSRQWKESFGFALIDDRGLLTAEFMVNGKHASLKNILADGDKVTIIPYICGG